MNTIQKLLEQKELDPKEDEKVTLAIIDSIQASCLKKDIQLVVSYMSDDAITKRLISHCQARSIPVIDLVVDLTKPQNTNAPHDYHPTAQAHSQYAQKLIPFLTDLNSTSNQNSRNY